MNEKQGFSVQITMADNYGARGRHKSEQVLPSLEEDIRSLVDIQSQADPKFQSTFLYTLLRMWLRKITSPM